MNKAIILATIQTKLKNLPAIGSFIFFSLILPIMFAALMKKSNEYTVLLTTIMQGSSFPIVIAFILQRDSFADSRSTSDGEFLALLFTRPISRIEYVMSKCMAVAGGVCLLLLVQMLVFHLAMVSQHLDDSFFVNPARVIDIFLGALNAAAIVSLINSVPKKLGVWLFLLVASANLLLGLPSSEPSTQRAGGTPHWYQLMHSLYSVKFAILGDNLYGFDLLNGSVTALSIVAYASNILLCLLGAAYILNRREFSYASE